MPEVWFNSCESLHFKSMSAVIQSEKTLAIILKALYIVDWLTSLRIIYKSSCKFSQLKLSIANIALGELFIRSKPPESDDPCRGNR